LKIDPSRISRHNEGLVKPIGIKVKEKSVRGSSRPVGGFEKATKKKKKTNTAVQLQPQSTTMVYNLNQVSHIKLIRTHIYLSFL
jgi:hypothetical protein